MKFNFWHTLFTVLACLASVHNALAQGLTFTTNTYSVGANPLAFAADINGDGRLDIITANNGTNTLTVLTNNGNGGFGFYATLKVGKYPGYVLAVDLNGNGKLELVTANNGDNTLTVLTNNGFGVFGSNATLNVGSDPQTVSAVDINGAGKMDLICANYTSPGTLTVYTNNGNGVFGFNATLNCGNNPAIVISADVNGDGKPDLITANQGTNTLTVLTNNGTGSFGFNATLTVGKFPVYIIVTDVNEDGKQDLISCNDGTNTLTILTNNGYGSFGLNATITNGQNQPFSVAAADLNGAGKLELISANAGLWPNGNGTTLTVFTNNGYGVFGSNITLNVGKSPFYMVAADVNADGKPDLISANYSANTVTVLLNTSIFSTAANFPEPAIKKQGSNLRVSWPSVSPGWSLQENPNLMNTNWLPSGYDGYAPAVNGGSSPSTISDDRTNKSLSFPASAGNRFFRLLHP